jgi:hypothetical protein
MMKGGGRLLIKLSVGGVAGVRHGGEHLRAARVISRLPNVAGSGVRLV